MHSVHNEGSSAVSKRFIRTLKNKLYNYMILISKKVCIHK